MCMCAFERKRPSTRQQQKTQRTRKKNMDYKWRVKCVKASNKITHVKSMNALCSWSFKNTRWREKKTPKHTAWIWMCKQDILYVCKWRVGGEWRTRRRGDVRFDGQIDQKQTVPIFQHVNCLRAKKHSQHTNITHTSIHTWANVEWHDVRFYKLAKVSE